MGIEVARLTGCTLVSASLARLKVGAEKISRRPKSAVSGRKKTSPIEWVGGLPSSARKRGGGDGEIDRPTSADRKGVEHGA